jgi:hypothetical protein
VVVQTAANQYIDRATPLYISLHYGCIFSSMFKICVAAQLAASQEGLSSMSQFKIHVQVNQHLIPCDSKVNYSAMKSSIF